MLSWVAERLGVAMKQAEDTILREYLVATATQYNCQGGKHNAPSKPLVIDLELAA